MAMTTMVVTYLKTDCMTWRVYCHPYSKLGQGSYGTVYRAEDGNGKAVAAKQISKDNVSKLTPLADLKKLMDLNHPNILTIFDIYEDEKAIWIIMELCEHGDLRLFMKKKTMTCDEKLQVMTQLAEGVQYLHENNIIHRDVKPSNILVDSVNPIHVKLTDFDLCKFLDEDCATSNMKSDVGTMAFKSPEFFMRNSKGELSYRRSVDVYALGLTCLAMIQHDDCKKPLRPILYTFTDNDYRYADSAGQLIAGNIKNIKKKKKSGADIDINEEMSQLSVVHTASVSADAAEALDSSQLQTMMGVQYILHNMTEAYEENRFSAYEVVETLQNVQVNGTALTSNAVVPAGTALTPNAMAANDAVLTPNTVVPDGSALTPNAVFPDGTVLTSGAMATNDAVLTPNTVVPEVAEDRKRKRQGGEKDTENQYGSDKRPKKCQMKLVRTSAWKTDMSSAHSVLPLNQHHILVYGERDWKICMRVFCRVDGALVKEIPSECNHGASSVCRHPVDCEVVLETCAECKKIRSYNTDTGCVSVVYKKKGIVALCRGPSDTVIAIEEGKYMYQLEWQSTKKQFAVVRIVDLKVMSLSSMCYIEDLDSVIIVSQNPCLVQSVKLDSGCHGNRLWTFNLEMCDEKEVNPNGLCFDTRERLYIGDMLNNRLLVFNAQRGGLAQVIDLDEDTSQVIDMYCVTEECDQLTLLQAGRRVSVCRIQEL